MLLLVVEEFLNNTTITKTEDVNIENHAIEKWTLSLNRNKFNKCISKTARLIKTPRIKSL